MKILDIFLILATIALLVISYFIVNAELKTLVSLCATIFGAMFGARWGGRIHKKNLENK